MSGRKFGNDKFEDAGALERWKGPDESSALPACSAPLSGRWRHGDGYLICGTLRIARADFDTDPSPEIQTELLDWIVSSLNEAQNSY